MNHFVNMAMLVGLQLAAVPALAQQPMENPAEVRREVQVVAKGGDSAAPLDVETEVRLREAETRLAEAARQVADLSMSQLPRVERIERIIRAGGGPVLGVTIGTDDETGPVDGVEIRGVSPGGAAEEAGLRTGDVISAINGESMSAEGGEAAGNKLLDFMKGVQVGDSLEVEYLRDGKAQTVELEPQEMSQAFAFAFGGRDFPMLPGAPGAPGVPGAPRAPGVPHFENFAWILHADSFGDMELAQLTEGLGRYFGTSKGLLVVRAPAAETLKLQDGDVILSVDGREPQTVAHAMRILGSYQSGEKLKLEIMRDKRRQTIEIEVPDNRKSVVSPAQPPVALVH